MDILKNRPSIVREAQKARFHPNFIIQLLIFIVVTIVTQIAAAIPVVIAIIIRLFSDIAGGAIDITRKDPFSADYIQGLSTGKGIVLTELFSSLIVLILVIVYCRFIEKRSLYSMGFVKSGVAKEYGKGIVFGALMFSACVLIAVAGGSLEYKGVTTGSSIVIIITFLIAFIIQGASEETLLRGYFMISVASKKPIILAILANSVLFSMMHLLNNGISIVAFINLILFGIFASVYTLRTNNLWGICAIHTVWNFLQGNFYGISVSGIHTGDSVLSFIPRENATLINGGAFGLEGGLAVTIVLIVSISVVLISAGFKSSQNVIDNVDISSLT